MWKQQKINLILNLILFIYFNLFTYIAPFNIFMDDQRRFTISVSSTHPTPGEDIHHTVISCVGN